MTLRISKEGNTSTLPLEAPVLSEVEGNLQTFQQPALREAKGSNVFQSSIFQSSILQIFNILI
jgi:hypothetical protein